MARGEENLVWSKEMELIYKITKDDGYYCATVELESYGVLSMKLFDTEEKAQEWVTKVKSEETPK